MTDALKPTPPPRPRLGPRPLPLQLATATATWTSSFAGLEMLKSSSPSWNPALAERVEALKESLKNVESEAFQTALTGEVQRRMLRFLTGIQAYRRHPYRRGLADPPTIWSEGSSRLLDYGATGKKAGGRPLLVVPSLINRFYVLDLSEKCSLMRHLAAQGLRPLLLDWGRPGAAEKKFTLDDYIAGRLSRALDATLDLTKDDSDGSPLLLGYCMGGLLALGLAALRPEDLRGLVLMATPWDFHVENAVQARLTAAAVDSGPLGPIIDGFGELPVDIIQVMFAGFDPMGVARKFIAFNAMAAESEEEPGQDTKNSNSASTARVEAFVSLEDWLNDGIPLPGPVARECISGWYGRNEPAQGRWRVGGKTVLPEEVNLPALVMLPEHDRIVPPLSALSLADALPRAERLMLPLGHIGMVVSARAPQLAWQPLTKWLQTTP